jgi:hypothetical protein
MEQLASFVKEIPPSGSLFIAMSAVGEEISNGADRGWWICGADFIAADRRNSAISAAELVAALAALKCAGVSLWLATDHPERMDADAAHGTPFYRERFFKVFFNF